jgi:type III pantothenate kinase
VLLVVDIGNTNVTFGVFRGAELARAWRIHTDATRSADEYGVLLVGMLTHGDISAEEVGAVALSSVVPALTPVFSEVAKQYFGCDGAFVAADADTGVVLNVDYPAEVGPDRIANAAAARVLYGAPVVVVDFGTTTNFDVIDADGAFIGGAFTPGIRISMDALFSRATLLRPVDLVEPPRVIGRNTVECLQSGLYYGFLGQMERMLERILDELGAPAVVVATGGLADAIGARSPLVHHVDPYLTLKGLELIHRRSAA